MVDRRKSSNTINAMSSSIQFSIDVNSLNNALTSVKQLISQSVAIPAYSGVLMKVDGDTLEITAADGEGNSSMTIALPIVKGVDGKVLIAPRPLSNLLSSIASTKNESQIEVSVLDTGDVAVESSGLAPYTFRPMTATFPSPVTPSEFKENVNFKYITDAVALCRKATSRDSASMQIVSDGESVKLNSTDGFRLASAEIPDAEFGDFTGVLSLGSFERIAKLKPHRISFDPKTKSITFANNNTVYSARLLAEPFQAVEVILDNAPPVCTSVNREQLLNAANRLSSTGEVLLLVFKDSTLTLTSGSVDVGEGKEVIALMKPVVAPFQAQLKTSYLQDALTSSSSATTDIAYSGEKKPIFFVNKEPLPSVQVIMTIQTY